MFSWYKYLIVTLVFTHLGFWSGNLFLIGPFPDLCLLVHFFQFAFHLDRSVLFWTITNHYSTLKRVHVNAAFIFAKENGSVIKITTCVYMKQLEVH